VVVLLAPGNRKSAVFADALRPLREIERSLVDAARPDVARAQSERRQREGRLKRLEQAASKGDETAAELARELAAELALETVPVLPLLIVEDATHESLEVRLAEQGGRLASMSVEGGVFDLMAGLYSRNGETRFTVYQKGHSGDDFRIDRLSRPAVDVKRPALTCAYVIQPIVIESLSKHPEFRGRGLLARFLYAAPASWIGHREIGPLPMPEPTRHAYHEIIRRLCEIEGEHTLDLTSEADELLKGWELAIERMLDEGGEMEMIRDWGAKLAGETLRIAAILHCVDYGPAGPIAAKTLESAIAIARYTIPHAEAVLQLMAASAKPDVADALYILRWVMRQKRREFTRRDLHQGTRRRFHSAEDIDPGLAELARRGYIRPLKNEESGPGRPSPAFEVHPSIICSISVAG
jgi:hypothetical protein